MSAMRCRQAAMRNTPAVAHPSSTGMRCKCFSASTQPPKIHLGHQSKRDSPSAGPWVCHSSILPSQRLQQTLDIQHTEPPQQQLPQQLETLAKLTSSAYDTPTPCQPNHHPDHRTAGINATRRDVAVVLPTLGAFLLSLGSLQLAQPAPAAASKLGAAADSAWEAMGGGPADLTFPENWLGVWDVTSTLVNVELPMGEGVVPNLASVQRAKKEDLQKPLQYQVAFMRNGSGRVIYDRRFNTAALLAAYYGSNMDFAGRINWNPQDPNALSLTMPGGVSVTSRVLRRSEEDVAVDRFETSEFMQQVFETDDPARPRVKASQCFTKYKFRDEAAAEAAGGPAIVATQVVSDYLTPFDGEQNYLAAGNKPITTYTYRMAFTRHHDAAHVSSEVAVS